MPSEMLVTSGLVKCRWHEYYPFLPTNLPYSDFGLFDSLNEALMIGDDKPLRNPPSLFKTPPYVTARPVVTHRKTSLPASDGSSPSQKAVQFLVLATDGLWDELRYYFFSIVCRWKCLTRRVATMKL